MIGHLIFKKSLIIFETPLPLLALLGSLILLSNRFNISLIVLPAIAFDKSYKLPLEKNHRFPMEKYDLLPQQLLLEGTIKEGDFFTPEIIPLDYVHRVHHPSYVKKLINLKQHTQENTDSISQKIKFIKL